MKNGFVLIGSLFLVMFIAIFLGIALMRTEIQLRAIELRRISQCAFYAAETGIERSIFELRKNATWRAGFDNETLTWTGPMSEGSEADRVIGTYSVQVATGLNIGNVQTLWLRSEGRAAQDPAVKRFIRARVFVQNPASYFVSSMFDLTIGSGTLINGDVLARDVIFEVNNALPDTDPRKDISVTGDVEYIRRISGEKNPYVHISGQATKRAPITFISVDLDIYRRLAKENGGRYVEGAFNYTSGDINWENLETQNGLVFVEGDVHISGHVTESIHIVSTGKIYIEGDILCASNETGKSQIGLSAVGDVIISGSAPSNINIDAFIISSSTQLMAQKTPAGKNTLNFNGAVAVRGAEGMRTTIDLNEYAQRNYTYDETLINNMQIPFMGYIVNLIEWREVPPLEGFPPQ